MRCPVSVQAGLRGEEAGTTLSKRRQVRRGEASEALPVGFFFFLPSARVSV